jgi:hypothetical protein
VGVDQCKRLHLAIYKAHPGAAVVAFILLVFWVAISCSRNSTAVKPDADHAEHYLGTWELTDPVSRDRAGISFLMIARETVDGSGYVVSSGRSREVFRLRDGRLIHDTVTILYNDTRDTISHSNFGELIRQSPDQR